MVAVDDLPAEVQYDIIWNLIDLVPRLREMDEATVRDNLFGLVKPPPPVRLGWLSPMALRGQLQHGTSRLNVMKLREKLQQGIELDPILVDRERFVDGHHRVEAYIAEGRDEIPVVDIHSLIAMDWDAWLAGENPADTDVWWHGSRSPVAFEKFRTEVRPHTAREAVEVPLFFTQDKSFAELHGRILYKVRLHTRKTFNSLDLYREGHRYWPPAEEELTPLGLQLLRDLKDGKVFPRVTGDDEHAWANFEDSQGLWAKLLLGDWDAMESPEMMRWIRDNGYDSFMVYGEGSDSVAVFDPAQVEMLETIESRALANPKSANPLSERNRALVSKYGGRIMQFQDLPVPAQLAIAYYMAMDGEAWPWSGESKPTLKDHLPYFRKQWGHVRFGIVELPMQALVSEITKDADVAGFESFEKYHKWYVSAPMPKHKHTERWPVILSEIGRAHV